MTRRRPTAADLVVEGVAAYRLTRLVTADVLTAPAREAVVEFVYVIEGRHAEWRNFAAEHGWAEVSEHDPDVPKLATLLTCRWCAGMWCAFAVLALRRLPGGRWLRDALALGAAAALIARLEDD